MITTINAIYAVNCIVKWILYYVILNKIKLKNTIIDRFYALPNSASRHLSPNSFWELLHLHPARIWHIAQKMF